MSDDSPEPRSEADPEEPSRPERKGRASRSRSRKLLDTLGIPDREPVPNLPLAGAAGPAAENLKSKLSDMLAAGALVRAHKRRASALDVTDYEAAYDDLVNPRPRPIWVEILTDIGVGLGGIIAGIGVSDLHTSGEGWLVLIAGIFVVGISTAFKYIRWN